MRNATGAELINVGRVCVSIRKYHRKCSSYTQHGGEDVLSDVVAVTLSVRIVFALFVEPVVVDVDIRLSKVLAITV